MNLQEAVIAYLIREYIDNPQLLRRLKNLEDELLTIDEVAGMLKCSVQSVRKLIKDGEWIMVIGPNGYAMTREQFREQRDKLLAQKRRGF